MPAWSHYFHFPTGTDYDIDGPGGYDGRGKVLENSAKRLSVRLDLDKWGPAPALHATVTTEYLKEGSGNRVVVEEDGKPPKEDKNATIRSKDSRRERAIDSGPVTFSVRFESEEEVDFDVYYDGRHADFNLML